MMAKRRYLTPLEKLVVLNRQDDKCAGCDEPGGPFVFDHIIQSWMFRPEDRAKANHIDNFQALCVGCNKPKTARDATVRAKTKRQWRKCGPGAGQNRPKARKLRSRPLQQTGSRKIASRGFDKRFKRRMDGTVVRQF